MTEPAMPEPASTAPATTLPLTFTGTPVAFTYTNWRGVTARRRVRPVRLWFGATEFHPEPQWLVHGLDLDSGLARDFALAAMRNVEPDAPLRG